MEHIFILEILIMLLMQFPNEHYVLRSWNGNYNGMLLLIQLGGIYRFTEQVI